jgi:putative transposase
MKQSIMDVIMESESKGMRREHVCSLLQIDERRVRHWSTRTTLTDAKPGPEHAPHALLPEEQVAIVALAKEETYVDDSHRVLTAKGIDAGRIAVSSSSVYRVMRKEGLTTDRSGRVGRTGRCTKPDRPLLTGPDQRWCWDISYLRTLVSGIFLFLYVVMDEYSRKVIAYRISWHLSYQEGKELIEEGLDSEGLTKDEIENILDLFNDRGAQMKAKPFKIFLNDLGISQKFSRPRTPNDNPYIESLFSTTKGAPEYPGEFVDDITAHAYFAPYFDYYNNVRLHGKIGYVTPMQRHTGKDKAILALRAMRLVNARHERLSRNRTMAGKMVPARQAENRGYKTMGKAEGANRRACGEVEANKRIGKIVNVDILPISEEIECLTR